MYLEFDNEKILEISMDTVYSPEAYPGDGLYLVHDSVVTLIALVTAGAVTTIILPDASVPLEVKPQGRGILKQLTTKIDTLIEFNENEVIERKLNIILDRLKERGAANSSNIDLEQLTKLVAVSQDASLLKVQ